LLPTSPGASFAAQLKGGSFPLQRNIANPRRRAVNRQVPTLAAASEGAIFANAVLAEANRLRQEQSETVKAIRDDIKAEFRAIREDAKAAQEKTQAEFRAIREDAKAAQEKTQAEFKAAQENTQAEFRAIREDAKAAQENTQAEFKAAQENTQAEFKAVREDVSNLNTTIKVLAASGGTVAVVVGLLANAGKILRLF